MSVPLAAVVPAAGQGRRLGGVDKALLELGGRRVLDRVVDALRDAGVDDVVVVRREDAAPVDRSDVRVATVRGDGEMIDSVRAGMAVVPAAAWTFVLPVDYVLAGDGVVAPMVERIRGLPTGDPARLVLPICGGRPGHPIAFAPTLRAEIDDLATATLRDVVRRDRREIAAVDVDNAWIRRDLDRPDDRVAFAAALRMAARPATAVMRAHRSRRAYADVDVPPQQVEWLVDTARYASTSSFIQAYSVVEVRDPARRRRVAALCADQPHVAQAPVFLGVCADLSRVRGACARHVDGDDPIDANTLEIFVQATVDAALFGQNLQLAAEAEGLGACMIGAARNHPVELAELLELPPLCYVVFGMTLGWPTDDPVPRTRLPIGAVLHRERYDATRLDEHLDAADDRQRAWSRDTNARLDAVDSSARRVNEERGWTDRMAWLWRPGASAKQRRSLAAELRRLGFGLETGEDDAGRA